MLCQVYLASFDTIHYGSVDALYLAHAGLRVACPGVKARHELGEFAEQGLTLPPGRYRFAAGRDSTRWSRRQVAGGRG